MSFPNWGYAAGFSIVPYQVGYEKEWAKQEYAIGDFDSEAEAEKYFAETYLQNPELLPNILFALNKDGDVVGCWSYSGLFQNSSNNQTT